MFRREWRHSKSTQVSVRSANKASGKGRGFVSRKRFSLYMEQKVLPAWADFTFWWHIGGRNKSSCNRGWFGMETGSEIVDRLDSKLNEPTTTKGL